MFDNKNYVIINNKKFYDDDLDFDDIPVYEESKTEIQQGSVETTTSGSNTNFSSGSGFQGMFSIHEYWIFSEHPFGLKSAKLDLFIDLLKIKKIKDLIKILSQLQKSPEKYKFDELLLILDEVVFKLLSKRLKDILLSNNEEEIDWKKSYKDKEKQIIENNENIKFEEDEEIVFLKKKLSH